MSAVMGSLLIIGCSVTPASALEYPEKPPGVGKLSKQAERIVIAKCLRAVPKREKTGTIWTYADFQVLDLVKGTLPPQFTLRVLGGTVDGVTVGQPGALPNFQSGEEDLLFLGPDNQDGYPTVFLTGVFRISRDAQTGLRFFDEPPSAADLTLLKAGTQTPIDPVNAPFTVEDVVYSIRRELTSAAQPSK